MNLLPSAHGFPPPPAGPARIPPPEPEEFNLGEWLANLWEGRLTILSSFLLFLALGVFMIWKSVPVYQIDAMLTIQGKRVTSADPAFARMEGLFEAPADAQTEIEILKSNLVIGQAVNSLGLAVSASPRLTPIIGSALARSNPAAPRIEVQTFEVPNHLQGKPFTLIAKGGGVFSMASPTGDPLGDGKVGQLLSVPVDRGLAKVQIANLSGKPGQAFTVVRQPIQAAIDAVRLNFDAYEKSKGTNVLGLLFKSTSPAKGTRILSEIVHQYILHKLEKRSGDSSQALDALQAKMPMLKAKLEQAEGELNAYRSRTGSVDTTREADFVLQQAANLTSQITALKQKREELLRTYKENADVVVTLNEQMRKLQSELSQVDNRARALPNTQQTVIRLTRNVQVAQDLYTALLNNVQQLQVSAGNEVDGFDLVDPPTARPDPIGPKKSLRLAVFGFLGILVGVLVVRLRRTLRRGIKDHRLIESKLGIQVLVTVPHSRNQELLTQAIRHRKADNHLLVMLNPDDLASESLRSLRTVLHFMLKDASSHVVMVTGSSPTIGKSFISSNLSATLAQTGNKVLLVDGDLRKGNLHHVFGLKARLTGLSDVLSGRAPWQSVVQATQVPGLDLMSTGIIPPNPSELLLSDAFTSFLKEVSEAYPWVIIDAPPVLAVTDATIIGTRVGAVLLVAKYGVHPLDEFRACQARLNASGVRILGCVFNDILPTGLGALSGDYRYSYHYTYKG